MRATRRTNERKASLPPSRVFCLQMASERLAAVREARQTAWWLTERVRVRHKKHSRPPVRHRTHSRGNAFERTPLRGNAASARHMTGGSAGRAPLCYRAQRQPHGVIASQTTFCGESRQCHAASRTLQRAGSGIGGRSFTRASLERLAHRFAASSPSAAPPPLKCLCCRFRRTATSGTVRQALDIFGTAIER